jgi:hypothetical protein
MNILNAKIPVTYKNLSINSAVVLTDNYIPQAERDKMPESDFADPSERKYPIKDQTHLEAACKLLGRAPAEKQASIKSRIKTIAKRKGLTLPDTWKEEE